MKIYFNDENAVDEKIIKAMERAASCCLESENVDEKNKELSVSFVTEEEIRALNRDHRGVDKITDVLSFPQFGGAGEIPDFEEVSLGDVVICGDRARQQAGEFGHSLEREIVYLFTHGVLHLLGYDHEDEKERIRMRKREEEVMARLGLGR